MNDTFRGFITQKSAQLQLLFSTLDEFLMADLRSVGTFTDPQQKIIWGMLQAAGIAKESLKGLHELVRMAQETSPLTPQENLESETSETITADATEERLENPEE